MPAFWRSTARCTVCPRSESSSRTDQKLRMAPPWGMKNTKFVRSAPVMTCSHPVDGLRLRFGEVPQAERPDEADDRYEQHEPERPDITLTDRSQPEHLDDGRH